MNSGSLVFELGLVIEMELKRGSRQDINLEKGKGNNNTALVTFMAYFPFLNLYNYPGTKRG